MSSTLGVDRAIKSPLWQQIDGCVIEAYGRVAVLRSYESDEHQIEAARVLNILQVYNKTFEPIFILWLFPLQLTFNYAIKDPNSHVMLLAMHLDLVVRHCIPTSVEIFRMAQEVVDIWRLWDKDLFSQVARVLAQNTWINAKDFPSRIIHPEISEANKISVIMKGRGKNDIPPHCLKIFTDPSVFVRKWIVEGFASILSPNALLFVWDQLFFNEWNAWVIRDVCLSLLFLLKLRFSKAKNYFGAREIFLCDPARLYTTDIRKAYIHVQNGNSFDDIPAMNRNAIQKSEDTLQGQTTDLRGGKTSQNQL